MFEPTPSQQVIRFCFLAIALAVQSQPAYGGEPQDDPNLDILRSAKLPTDGPGLLKVLEAMSGNDQDWQRLDELIGQLGSANFAKWDEASRKIVAAPFGVFPVFLSGHGPFINLGAQDKRPAETSAAKTDMDKIQGTWIQKKRTLNGREYEPGEYDLTLDIQRDKVIMAPFDFPEQQIGEYMFSLDDKKKPKWFTWTAGKVTQLGIYEIKDDELTIKFDYCKDKKDERPADFATGREMDLMVFKRGKLPSKEKPDMPVLLKQWEKDVRERMDKDPNLKKLAAKYPLVLLHSRHIFQRWGFGQSSFSFTHETADPKIHQRDAQLQFHNGGYRNLVDFNLVVGQQNLVIDLGSADFLKDPDPKKISIDDRRILNYGGKVAEGHVYLERVRDDAGNDFYVLFQVVGLDQERGHYMAFLWRRLPGGRVVKR